MTSSRPHDPPPPGHAAAGADTPAEARLRAIIDSALDAVVTTDADSVITGWSAHAERMFGWTAAEAVGRTLGETIIPPRYREPHRAGVRRYLETGDPRILNQRIEIAALRRDGREIPVELTVAHARWGGEDVFSAFIRDLTESRRAEARLAAEHAVTRVLAEAPSVHAAAVPVLRAMGEALGWGVGSLWTEDAGRMRVAAQWHAEGVDAAEFEAASRRFEFAPGEGLPGRAWARRAPVWVVDATRDPEFPRAPYALRAGLHAALAFPVLAGGDVLGVVEFFAREATEPDEALLAMTRAIGSEMGQAFRRMRAEAERDRALAEAEATNEMLRRANAQLTARTAESERASRAKSDFLAVMSHELRTPINAVLGYTDLLGMEIAGPVTEAQRGYLERVRASGTHLLGLIDDVLDLSRVEAGRMAVSRERGPVHEVVAESVALVAAQAAAKGVGLESACGSGGPAYLGDPHRVRQILLNLLSNAVKFTPAGGSVHVRCGTGAPRTPAKLEGPGPWACIRVEDTGPGIAPEETEAVFEPFVQSESPHTRTAGGTGLGLSISRRLARLMEGDVTLETELGRGACFTLWLPAAAGAEAEAEPGPARPETAATDETRALARTGEALQQALREVLDGYLAALRAEPDLPAAGLADADLADHQGTFLADVAQCLLAMADGPGDVSLLQDGTEVQRLLAFRHGEQRARLGWTEAGIRREFALLADAVRAVLPDDALPPAAWSILSRFLHRGEEVSASALSASRASPPLP